MQANDGFRFTLVDFDQAMNDLLVAEGATPVRRATRALLACMYELRSARENDDKLAYQASEKASAAGETVVALNALRGKFTHLLAHALAPAAQPLYPGADVYPSERLLPGVNLRWPSAAEVRAGVPGLASDKRFAQYEQRVAGQLVYVTFEQVRLFLVDGVTF